MATEAPSRANSNAIACPIPESAPVITTTLLASLGIYSSVLVSSVVSSMRLSTYLAAVSAVPTIEMAGINLQSFACAGTFLFQVHYLVKLLEIDHAVGDQRSSR